MSAQPTKLQQVAQRNGGGARVPRQRPLPADHEAVVAVWNDIYLHGTAGPCLGLHRGRMLTESGERAAAFKQYGTSPKHRGVA